ncbi:myb domain-containing protein [Angomonas deanei]|uniref:Uncharacterized protein n=1 Tax=Angomonas deanei TaxID=59799 RepID=A0A7G2CKZ1_9TRYP|nr:myb domain-containing protein [Angomonas deanei]CAD2220065.1 hypothetical protein, conserved [Angomonas deanei]|eukprot:EPY21932.1 myb domain-containing protein [Angomonas deanei]
MAQQQQHQQTPDPTPQRRELEQALHEKEVSLAEREKVLDRREKDFQSLLSLYELTYEHVDQLQKGVLPSHNKTNANHNHNNSHSDMQSQFQRELNHSSQLAKHLIVNHRNNKSNQNNSYTDPLSASPSLLDVIEVDMKTEEEEYTNNNNLNRTPPQQRMVSSSPTPHSQPPSHVKLGNNDNNNNTVDLLRQTPPVLPNLGSDHLMPVNNAPFTATSSGRKYSGDKWNNNNNMNNANRREVSRSLGFEEDDGTNPNNNNKNTPKKEESPFRASTPKARRGSRGEHLPAASPYDLHPATVINDKTVSSVTDLYHTLEALQQEFKLQSARSPSSRRTPSPSVYSTPKVTTSDRNNHHHPTESGKLKTNMSVNTTTATSSARSSRKINHNNNSGKRSYENTKSRYQASNNSNHNNKSYVPTTLEGAELLRKLRGM